MQWQEDFGFFGWCWVLENNDEKDNVDNKVSNDGDDENNDGNDDVDDDKKNNNYYNVDYDDDNPKDS